MYSVNAISDYIINACKLQGNTALNILKHQKLLYYVQAWHLAFYDRPAFNEEFEAWVHGPVNRSIYNSYKDTHSIYSELEIYDVKDTNFYTQLDPPINNHINSILDVYAKFSGSELEEMTHNEDPWINARIGFNPYQICEKVIPKQSMREYYKKRLN
ncbi:Panacea domain-containing protein [Sphingobacterium multivorum]|uniref:Uncharacterized phage-associated protein n=1 Tax=Sphingobacterium multivorum TaxID=28454 RepID=A0A2X2JWS0_SPHMU|nr:type II toxin-antitoxin system antitoxin SocA domain-containing protein [Sphingobacterium multivorum]QRQ59970.1 SocA family protein [Sphingobacterium multivorum]SPZ92175.1 Uncharacterized phage-associated protein [Sphingobacterium multivorum]